MSVIDGLKNYHFKGPQTRFIIKLHKTLVSIAFAIIFNLHADAGRVKLVISCGGIIALACLLADFSSELNQFARIKQINKRLWLYSNSLH